MSLNCWRRDTLPGKWIQWTRRSAALTARAPLRRIQRPRRTLAVLPIHVVGAGEYIARRVRKKSARAPKAVHPRQRCVTALAQVSRVSRVLS
jgi:hypothetical protein